MSADLEQRLQRLEDVEAIRNLKHAYCYACDDNYNVEQLKKLFAPDAVWEAEGFGTYTGPDEIAGFFNDVSSSIVAAAHLVMNDLIHIADDGKTAQGIWRNSQPITIKGEDGKQHALWMLARYDEDYIKIGNGVNAEWYFQKLVATIQYSAPYEDGWADIWPSTP
ncbi:MAG: nuclear transport factor 2 family protein [Planctomycetes bacterium]|nr:nuclear transport factor 2 family protein [Planctomycetota bacterium]